MKRAIIGVVMLLVALAGVTWWALEAGGVAVVETVTAEGTPRSTHVWFAEMDGSLWLEAGAPENGWFQDVQRDPRLVLHVEDREMTYVAHPVALRSVHDALRSRLREKYGLRDWWVGLLVDQQRSSAVRLAPAP